MEQILQKAVRSDLKEIVNLYKEAISNMISNHILQWDEIYPNEKVLSEDIEKGELYLWKVDNRICACVVINEMQDEEYQTGNWRYQEGRTAVIHRLCVHPDTQGIGIGKRIVQFVEVLAAGMGYENIRLDVFSQNPKARHMYESLGYTYVGEVTFRKGQFYLMEKKLIK